MLNKSLWKNNKKKLTKQEKLQIFSFHAFFLFIVCIAIFIFAHETLTLKETILRRLKSDSKLTASDLSSEIKTQINAHFHDLDFLRKDFLKVNYKYLSLSRKSLNIFKSFKKYHPGISTINILNSSMDKVIWSSSKNGFKNIKNTIFTQISGYKDRYVGTLYFEKTNKKFVIPMNEHILGKNGTVLGFIGSPFILSNFSLIRTPHYIETYLIEKSSGKTILFWKNGKLNAGPDNTSNFLSGATQKIKGYPWIIKAGWTNSTYEKFFWNKEWIYLIMTILFAFIFAVFDIISIIAFKRIMRLKRYQSAAISAQEDALYLKDAQTIYKHIVDIIVAKTDAIGSILVVPDKEMGYLIPVAACADDKEHEKNLLKIQPYLKSDDTTENMPVSIAYKEKKAVGPIYSLDKNFIDKYPTFLKVKSLMAFPIYEDSNSDPVAVLGIQSDSKHYFTKEMVRIINQLVNSLGLALNKLSINNRLIYEAEHQKRLTEFNFLLAQMNQLISRTENEKMLLDSICEMTINYTGLKSAWIAKPDEKGSVWFISNYGTADLLKRLDISVNPDVQNGYTCVGRSWRSKKPVYIPSFREDNYMHPWLELFGEFDLTSSASIPVFRGGSIWAVFTLLHSKENFFDEDLKNILEEIALDIGFGLDRIDLINSKERETEIRNALLSNTSAGIALISYPERVFIEANDAVINTLGYSDAGSLKNFRLKDIYPDDETYKRVAELADKILIEGKGLERDISLIKKDGTIIYVDFYGQKINRVADGKEQILWTITDITERHRLAEELSYQAFYDELTGLPNRRSLLIELERAISRASRRKKFLALAIIDIDDFKPINDTFGHHAGDNVLKIISARIKEVLRKSDFTARLGGDEFVIIIEDINNKNELETILEKIEKKIKESILLENKNEISTGLSMGIYMFDGSIENKELPTTDNLLRYADQALYDSKNKKGDRLKYYAFYGETLPYSENNMQKLLKNGNLSVYYQPIMDNYSRDIVGVEALARLNDKGDIISPYNFLPMLNEKDLFYLCREMLAKSFIELSEIGEPAEKLFISINVDPKFISEEFISCLKNILETGCDSSKLVLEILETGDFLSKDNAIKYIHAIKDLGVKVALDDVGSAYSSLMRLKELPVDEIKLDQFFVRTLEDNPRDLHFVQSILELANDKKVNLIVEGVETDDILDALSVMDVDYLQGYAIAKPMPIDSLKNYLINKPLIHRKHPKSFLGLYAIKIVSYRNIKKIIRRDPYLIDYKNIKDQKNCPIIEALKSLNVPANHVLYDLHLKYDKAIVELGESLKLSGNCDWKTLDMISESFENEILAEYYKKNR